MTRLAIATAAVAAGVGYVQITVPLPSPSFSRAEAGAYGWVAAAGALGMLLATVTTIWLSRLAWRREPVIGSGQPRSIVPLHRLPLRGVLMAGGISSALGAGGLIEGLPLWGIALAVLLPWIPVLGLNAAWQTRHFGLYGLFSTLMLVQLGHITEHAAEMVELVVNHGNLALSHGVFGVLDNEVVHFHWNIAVWLGLAVLLYRYGKGNPWLLVAFVAASLHMVEHAYLYWLYVFHQDFWLAGGWAGILGDGGLIGSPLNRPALHFVYNYLEVAPMLIAFLDQTRRISLPTRDRRRTVTAA